MRTARFNRNAFVLAEMLISIVIFTVICMGLVMGMISLERNFVATTDFATNHADAIRISDYLALDLRRALTVSAAQNNTTITIPSYYDANGLPQMPTLDGSGGVYLRQRDQFDQHSLLPFRWNDLPTRRVPSPTVAIAENVRDFIFDVTDSGKVVTTRITFDSDLHPGRRLRR